MAKAAKVTESYLSKLERGNRDGLSPDVALRIARALQLDPIKVKRTAGILTEEDRRRHGQLPMFHQVVNADPHLTARQKRNLIETYEIYVPESSSPSWGSESKV